MLCLFCCVCVFVLFYVLCFVFVHYCVLLCLYVFYLQIYVLCVYTILLNLFVEWFLLNCFFILSISFDFD